MDYDNIYNNLISKAQSRILEESVYVEHHHVVPKCVGGSDNSSNLVALTPEEHMVAHLLLIKMRQYKSHPNYYKLVFAANMMTVGRKVNKAQYGWLKRLLAQTKSKIYKGKKQAPETVNKRRAKLIGKKRTDESKERYRQSKLGKTRKPFTESHLANMRAAKIKKPFKHSEESKRRISESNKGKKKKPMSQEQKEYLSKLHTGKKDKPSTTIKRSESAKLAWIARKLKSQGNKDES
jgi:hypothetical protein